MAAYIATFSVQNAHPTDIFAVAATKEYTISAGGDGKIRLWDNASAAPEVLEGNPSGVHHIAVDEPGRFVVAVFYDGSIAAWRLDTKQRVGQAIFDGIRGAWDVAVSPRENLVAIALVTGEALVVSLGDQLKQPIRLSTASAVPTMATSIDITADESFVAVGLDSGKVHVFSIESKRLVYTLPCFSMSPRVVRFSPNASLVAVAGDSDSISLFSLNGGDLVGSLVGHSSWIFNLAFSETGEYLASVAQEGKAKIWDVGERTCVTTLSDSSRPLFSVAWLNKSWGAKAVGGVNKGIVTAGLDRTLRWYRDAGK